MYVVSSEVGGLFVFFFFSSRRRHTRCREVSWARRCVQETEAGSGPPTFTLSPLFLQKSQSITSTIPDLLAPPNRIASGRQHPGDVSSQHLVPGQSVIYLIRLRSKSVVIFANYSVNAEIYGLCDQGPDMLTYLFYLLSKPVSPPCTLR
eukprot:TRINITY_DN17474_c0_g1_i3.p3 TRINITY_DN17474_c0_g1~~TRINITY_DN17474_c0_g1_i3.p3  ORF type:complete len:149 (-),score=18.63 TRINITY_DN17474_c0_g1_i3:191-637(-)